MEDNALLRHATLRQKVDDIRQELKRLPADGSARAKSLAKIESMLDALGEGIDHLAAGEEAQQGQGQGQNLTANQPKYRIVFEKAANPILIMDQDGRYLDANPAALEFFETDLAALRRTRVWDWAPPMQPESQAQARRLLLQPRLAEVSYQVGERIKTLLLNTVPAPLNGRTVLYGIGQDISERKAAERRYRALFEHMSNGVAIYQAVDGGEDFVFSDLNPIGCRGAGVGREQVVGRRVREVFPGVEEMGLFDTLRDVYRTGLPRHLATSAYRDERINIWVENYVFRLDSGEVVAVYDDVTERHLAAVQLRESESRLRQVVQNMPVMLDALSDSGEILFWNAECERVTGFSAEELVGNPAAMELLYPDPDYRAEVWRRFAELGNDFKGEISFVRCKDGEERAISWSNVSSRAPIPGWETWAVGVDITELHQALASLERSEERFRQLFATSPDALALATLDQGRFVDVNRAFCRMTGYSRDEAMGRTSVKMNLWENPEDRDRILRQLLGEDGQPGGIQMRFRRKDGSLGWGQMTMSRLSLDGVEHVLTATRDLSDLFETQRRLARSEQRLSLALEAAGAGLWDADLKTKRTFLSARYYTMLGYEPNDPELKTETWPDRLHPEDRDQAMVQRKLLVSGKVDSLNQEFRLRCKDGSYRHFLSRGRVVEREANGRTRRMAGITIDITDRKQLEARMLQLQKLESLAVVAGGVAHDFNNLLMGILGNAELALEDSGPRDPVRESLEQIRAQGRRAAELTGQMLSYAGKGRAMRGPVDLSAMLEELDALVRSSLGPGTTLELDLASGLTRVEADRGQMEQVVFNLVANAVEAMAGGGVVRLSTGEMVCEEAYLRECFAYEGQPPGRYVYLQVADQGPGVDPAIADRVFDPFFTTKFAGRGLGLSAVLGIVRAHKGALRLESRPGEGACVRVLLPARAQSPARPVPLSLPADGQVELAGSVLVVDDEAQVRQVTSRMLGRWGLNVVPATGGREALEIFRTRHRDLDLVLLDLTMPDMAGEEVYAAMAEIDPGVPVVVASGYGAEELARRFPGGEAEHALQKPFRPAELLAAIWPLLQD